MTPPPACRICTGVLSLARPGRPGPIAAAAFAPSCHEAGAHGDLLRCRECGTVQQPSLPAGEELVGLYREMTDTAYLEQEAGRRQTVRRLLELVGAHVPAGRLLEVGCGHGLLLDEAARLGYEVTGLEPARQAAAHARERYGLDVRELTVDDPSLDEERFDVVVMADVLEHVENPCAALDRCTSLLAEGGVMLIVTPDPSSATARLAGARWWGFLPGHVCLLPHRTLLELLIGRGLLIAADVPLVRSFTPGYWAKGLGERSRMVSRLAERVERHAGDRLWSLTLGDERAVLARRVTVQLPERPLASLRGREHVVCAVLPAYNATRTIARVAEEMPTDAIDRALVVDDASPDETTSASLAAGFEVLRHPSNRGYGANQKSCYVRAALDGADIVVMVHGDNQYDPALVGAMVKPIEEGRADVVIGSRLLKDEAIAGGMPRWKWVGNRFLTRIENAAFGHDYSEYHTGYRAFSVDFLRTIAFTRNNDDFVFDQQIFAQITARGARVVELAIPTRYFLEASSVSFGDSVVYGLKTLGVLARYRLNRRRRGGWALLRQPAIRLEPVASFSTATHRVA
ncbi:MAG: methyltransferase domain-containing protein [Solirubrobacterales bacterium]|nr:methyltransferase domain-containing protein [Solirubrobacterales bacterium]